MLKLEGLKLAPEEKEAALHRRAARLLRIPEEDVLSVQVLRRSIDAREELHLVYTVAAEVRQEKQVLRRCRDRRVSRFAPERYALPEVLSSPEVPPVVKVSSAEATLTEARENTRTKAITRERTFFIGIASFNFLEEIEWRNFSSSP